MILIDTDHATFLKYPESGDGSNSGEGNRPLPA